MVQVWAVFTRNRLFRDAERSRDSIEIEKGFAMSMPKINHDCIMAVIEKAWQVSPEIFVAEFLAHLIKTDQKPATMALMALQEKFGNGDEEVGLKIMASVGVFWKQIETMMEAEELENLFAEGEANVE